jgi:hypothetical protein
MSNQPPRRLTMKIKNTSIKAGTKPKEELKK